MSDRPAQPPDPDRRRFFRQFAGDVLSSVGSVVGAAQVLQQQSADAARDLLGGEEAETTGAGRRATTAGIETDASTAGWRAPLRCCRPALEVGKLARAGEGQREHEQLA